MYYASIFIYMVAHKAIALRDMDLFLCNNSLHSNRASIHIFEQFLCVIFTFFACVNALARLHPFSCMVHLVFYLCSLYLALLPSILLIPMLTCSESIRILWHIAVLLLTQTHNNLTHWFHVYVCLAVSLSRSLFLFHSLFVAFSLCWFVNNACYPYIYDFLTRFPASTRCFMCVLQSNKCP